MLWNDTDMQWMKRAIALAREGKAEPGKNPGACRNSRDGAGRREIKAQRTDECRALHDAAALRDVHHGFDLGQNRPYRLWRRP